MTSPQNSQRKKRLPRAAFWNKKQLKDRGWTDKLIRDFLGEPDELRGNPYYRSAAPQRLFLCERVDAIESTSDFLAAQVKAKKRSAAAGEAAETRWHATLDEVSELEIEVVQLDRERLIQDACASYNVWKAECLDDIDDSFLASSHSDRDFLDRICVNYVRHQLTNYDDSLSETRGKVGAADARDAIRDEVFHAIAQSYPYLSEECDRQRQRQRRRQEDRFYGQ